MAVAGVMASWVALYDDDDSMIVFVDDVVVDDCVDGIAVASVVDAGVTAAIVGMAVVADGNTGGGMDEDDDVASPEVTVAVFAATALAPESKGMSCSRSELISTSIEVPILFGIFPTFLVLEMTSFSWN